MARAYVALGTNKGDREANLRFAQQKLAELPGTTLVAMSPAYENPAVGGPAGQQDFLNAAASLDTNLPPSALLDSLLKIERDAGRDRSTQAAPWGPRPLDLDLLLYDDRVLHQPGLTIPHPRMHQRWFVLRPLADIAPDVMHPVLKRTINELLQKVEPQMNTEKHG